MRLLVILALLFAQSSGNYPIGTELEVSATASPGFMFAGWEGDIAGPENPMRFVVTGPLAFNATWIQIGGEVPVTVTSDVGGSVSVAVVGGPPPPDPPVCGDGVVVPPEECDDGNVVSGDGCSGACALEPPPPTPFCGDGNIDAGELCDGGNLGGATCQSEGFDSGSLACDAICEFDTSGCSNDPPPPGGPPGWSQLPNTKLRAVCPPNGFGGAVYPWEPSRGYEFQSYCGAIIAAWGSGTIDPVRNRMIIWGGGHADYYGNEVYALDLAAVPPMMTRLTDPSVNWGFSASPTALPDIDCRYAYADGKISSRHTYDGIEYIPGLDEVVLYGGSRPRCGFFAGDLRRLNLTTHEWTSQPTTGVATPLLGAACGVYQDDLFCYLDWTVYRLDTTTWTWSQFSNGSTHPGYSNTAVVGPTTGKMYVLGRQGLYVVDLTAAPLVQAVRLTTTGGEALMSTGQGTIPDFPGLAFHPDGRLVAWVGGNTVYALDLATLVWTPHTYPGGPATVSPAGTYHRFSYVPTLGGFVLVNHADQDAYVFRLP